MKSFSDPQVLVEEVIKKVGKKLVVGTCLGIGKPNSFLNALYDRVKADPSLELQILTGLTLQKPYGKSEMETRFLNLFTERLFGAYPDLHFEKDRIANQLPKNVQVIEFFFPPGKYLGHSDAQRNYVSSNYTHAARDLNERGVNVLAQLISSSPEKFSLSANPDVALDLVPMMRARSKDTGQPVVVIGEVNRNLPYMYGDCEVEKDFFDFSLDNPQLDFPLFGTPKESINDQDYLIGLYTSTLIKDGGELQIGIGSLGDAIVYFLKQRHLNPNLYQEVLKKFSIIDHFGNLIKKKGGLTPFIEGIYSATEMLIDGFLHLLDAGILKREVFEDIPLQRLLNKKLIDHRVTENTLLLLLKNGAICDPMTEKDIIYLKKYGILKAEAPSKPPFKWEDYLGETLKGGIIIHGGFFLGPSQFYEKLFHMDIDLKRKINMTSVCRINQLYGHEELDRLHRKDARFINTTLMVTLSGAAVSDGLQDNQVLSGVGGQYNFVSMAQALPDGHSILCFRSTRSAHGKTHSNIVWQYPHTTIPRHLRDIFINEYGIADLRSKTDEEIIIALLNITDSRFQKELLERAKKFGKLRQDYQIPIEFQNNFPEVLLKKLQELRISHPDLAPLFPFGSELTVEEITLGRALKKLKSLTESKSEMAVVLLKSLFKSSTPNSSNYQSYLAMMNLDSPKSIKETIMASLLHHCLVQTQIPYKGAQKIVAQPLKL